MLTSLMTIIHVGVCVALILIILLQTGKGAGMGAAFGGASQTVFGSTGRASFLTKVTIAASVVFILTSVTLSFLETAGTSMMDTYQPEQPTTPTQPGLPSLPDIPTGVSPNIPGGAPGGEATVPLIPETEGPASIPPAGGLDTAPIAPPAENGSGPEEQPAPAMPESPAPGEAPAAPAPTTPGP